MSPAFIVTRCAAAKSHRDLFYQIVYDSEELSRELARETVELSQILGLVRSVALEITDLSKQMARETAELSQTLKFCIRSITELFRRFEKANAETLEKH